MPWKPEYEANRQARIEADPEYRARYEEQQRRGARTPEENREYMREYYQANKDQWNRRTPEQREAANARRRERYATDPEYRERVKASIKAVPPERRRDSRMRKQFGIGAAEFDAMVKRQGGGCAICGTTVGDSVGRRLAVDHCHDTGRIRGILCSRCNRGLGYFGDDRALIQRAADYLA